MRLFIAAWPPQHVTDAIRALARPEHPAVRWARPDQWHVTLRFLGEVPEPELDALTAALRPVGARPVVDVELGPVTQRLSRSVLVVPVTGLDDLGSAVIEATRAFGKPPEERPFAGHLTLARGRRGRPVPVQLAGQEIRAAWRVEEVSIVRSRPASTGARYETLVAVPLTGPTSRGSAR